MKGMKCRQGVYSEKYWLDYWRRAFAQRQENYGTDHGARSTAWPVRHARASACRLNGCPICRSIGFKAFVLNSGHSAKRLKFLECVGESFYGSNCEFNSSG